MANPAKGMQAQGKCGTLEIENKKPSDMEGCLLAIE
jgi:hypothetical protein